MRYLLWSVIVGALLLTYVLGTGYAAPIRTGAPTPVVAVPVSPPSAPINPPSVPIPPPSTPISVSPPPPTGPVIYVLPPVSWPLDFHLDRQIVGYGFKPAERVSIGVQHVSAAGKSVVADADGGFQTSIAYTWMFCGPRGKADPPPVYLATGNEGSQARTAEAPVMCPVLLPDPLTGVPPGQGGAAPPGPINGASTSVPPDVSPAGTSIVVPTPPAVQPPDAFKLQSTIRGFGFVSGEQVTMFQRPGPYPTGPRVNATADSSGRITVSLQISWPVSCGAPFVVPMLVAQGNSGTAVISPFYAVEPLPALCPTPVGTPMPPGIPLPQTPTPASPPLPAAQPPVLAGGATISLRVGRASIAPGSTESVAIRSDGTVALTLSARYPGGAAARQRLRIDGKRVVRWHVPRSAQPGLARISAATQDGVVLRSTFSIR